MDHATLGLRRSPTADAPAPWASLLGVLILLLALPPCPAPAAAGPFPATVGTATMVMGGTHYLDIAPFLARYGLAQAWLVPAQRGRFTSAWSQIEIEADSREIRFNGLRLFMGDAALPYRGGLWVSRLDVEKLLVPLLKPAVHRATARPPRVIAIDAGHGGRDTGTRNVKLRMEEKDLTLDVAKRVAAVLESEGYRVVMTRSDDRYLPLADRAEIANAAGADLFVSVHFNSGPAQVRGIETYLLTPQDQRSTGDVAIGATDRQPQAGNQSDPWNAVLGFQLHRHLIQRLGSFDRGLKRARFAVLRRVECPAALVEVGYLSNDEEAMRIAGVEYRSAVAEAIASGIAAYAVQAVAAQTE